MESWIALVSTILTTLATIVTVIITTNRTNANTINQINSAAAVRDEKIEELTREVRRHNNFAERLPVVEGDIKVLVEQNKVTSHRLDDLERAVSK